MLPPTAVRLHPPESWSSMARNFLRAAQVSMGFVLSWLAALTACGAWSSHGFRLSSLLSAPVQGAMK